MRVEIEKGQQRAGVLARQRENRRPVVGMRKRAFHLIGAETTADDQRSELTGMARQTQFAIGKHLFVVAGNQRRLEIEIEIVFRSVLVFVRR